MKKKSLLYFTNLQFRFLVQETDKKTLAYWAIDCAERVMHYFESNYPNDKRPRVALETLQKWIETGEFSMKVIRKASLDSHAAARSPLLRSGVSGRARELEESSPARSVARACGQAVATAHVARHALGSALYALQAIYLATGSEEEVEKERDWQYKQLTKLISLK